MFAAVVIVAAVSVGPIEKVEDQMLSNFSGDANILRFGVNF